MKTKKINNRTIIGIVCIVLALVVTFGVSPLVNRISDQKTDIVRVKNTIERGQQITANDLEIVRVGSYNLPDGVIKDGKSVVGKYATATLFAGDYLFSEKITGESNSAADILAALDGKEVAISVSIGSYADGLSGKLENGDIISIIIYNKEEYRSYIPAELRYVRVISRADEEKEGARMNVRPLTYLNRLRRNMRKVWLKSFFPKSRSKRRRVLTQTPRRLGRTT